MIMLKLPLKIVFFPFFCLAAAFLMSACLEPQNVGKFLESDEVQDKIERTRVGLTDLSGDGLFAGNERITGLKPDKYYRVEIHEEDEDDEDETINILTYKFVSREGRLVDKLEDANRAPGTAIINLSNSLNYIVYSASPLSGSMTIYHVESPAMIAAAKNSDVTELYASSDGISIRKPEDTHTYYLELPEFIKKSVEDGNTFQILLVPVNTTSTPRLVSTIPGHSNIIQLRGEGTITDYVFVEYDDKGKIIGFYTLKVFILGETPEDDDGIKINITFNIESGEVEFDSNITVISQADLVENPRPLFVNIINPYIDNPDIIMENVVWKYNGEEIALADEFTLVIDFTDPVNLDYLVEGSHVFSILFNLTIDGVSIPYSASYTVKINP